MRVTYLKVKEGLITSISSRPQPAHATSTMGTDMKTKKVLFVPLEDSDGPMRYVDLPTSDESDRIKAEHVLASVARTRNKPPLDASDEAIRQYAAEHFYGYGNWEAPYYFIGPEPGKAKSEGNNLNDRCRAWLDLCRDGSADWTAVDCREHHTGFKHLDFFERKGTGQRPPTQSTWRQLIRLLLRFEQSSKPITIDAIADYQMAKWGSKDGNTCVVELAALATNSLSTSQEYREMFRARRAEYLRSRVVIEHPVFAIMYGGGKALLPWWQYIASGNRYEDCFESRQIEGFEAKFLSVNGIVFVVARHPVNPGGKAPPNEYWTGIADALKQIIGRPSR